MKSVQATRESYRIAHEMSPHFSYQEFAPTKKYGQVTVKAEYKGVQIVDFMNHPFQPSYDFIERGCAERDWHKCQQYAPGDAQYEALVNTLDENKPAIFVQHTPMNRWGTVHKSDGSDSPAFISTYCRDANTCNSYSEASAKDKYLHLVNKFNQNGKSTRVFGGHNHRKATFPRKSGNDDVTELVAPYPLEDKGIAGNKGVYAVLMDPQTGVVEVQALDL